MKVFIALGETLAEALRKRKLYMDMPCGGNGICGRCRVYVEDIGWVQSCQFRQPGEYEIRLPAARDFHAVVFQAAETEAVRQGRENCKLLPARQGGKSPLVVMDLGTTTVVMGVFYWGKEMIRTFVNPQRAYGADVMSRIRIAAEGKGEELQNLLLGQIVLTLEDVLREWKLLPDADTGSREMDLLLSANTTMQHLAEGLPCGGLGVSPFQPADISWHKYMLLWDGKLLCQSAAPQQWDGQKGQAGPAEQGGGRKPWKINAVALPGISAFIGADIVSGIYALSITEEESPVLLLDLGTNGEMVLGCKERLLAASAAAGPAFEGSELALDIHGAGIMKLLHQMLEEHVLDETGLLADDFFETGYPALLDTAAAKDRRAKQDGTRITQEDIRQLQMAKAAVCAGIRVLLEEYGILPEEVAKVYLAGGMGYYLDPADAFAIGLLPKEFAHKTRAVGNTSYQGALRYAQNPKAGRKCMERIVKMAQEVVLSGHPLFEGYYMEGINFPKPET